MHVFHGLDNFIKSPSLSVHDFDALTQLRFLKKLGKLVDVYIIGISLLLTVGESEEYITQALVQFIR